MELLFAYGTLRNRDVQEQVIKRVAVGVPDRLIGYRKSTMEIDGEIFPALVEDPHSIVDGILLEVKKDELPKLDRYEGDAYKRKRVVLNSGKKAWTYMKQ